MLASSLINLKRFLKALIENKFQIFRSKLFHSAINTEKGIFEKFMSDLKTQDIAALRTSCNTDVIDWRN